MAHKLFIHFGMYVRVCLNSMRTFPSISLHIRTSWVVLALWGLLQLLVHGAGHLPPELCEHCLQGGLPPPVPQGREPAGVHAPIPLVDGGHVDLGAEPDEGCLVGVVVAALNAQGVDPSVVRCARWPDDGARPAPHAHIVRVVHAVGHGAIAETLLAPLQLLQQPEIARY